jgi:ATP-dependent Clp protease ATP-binding subunit ClpX
LSNLEPEDLIRYGLIPEFVGRLPVMATLEELDEDALVRSSPSRARADKQYARLFEMEGCRGGVARRRPARRRGRPWSARPAPAGLRSIMEQVFSSTSCTIPSRDDVDQGGHRRVGDSRRLVEPLLV